jgi:dTDP-4-dehydrorhamnose reductase
MQKKVLITGGSGLLAVNWALSIRNNHEVTLLLHHKKISLSGVNTNIVSLNSLSECLSVLEKYQPDIVIHTAALANIEECESNPELAYKTNAELAKNIAIACDRQDIKLVHISTDHLFSGQQSLVAEDEPTSPINIYAKTKLQGENLVLENCKEALIVRTNFFGWGMEYRQSFSDFIITKLRKNEKIDLFNDIFFTPILIDELCQKVHALAELNAHGVFNIVGGTRLSKYEFGIKLAEGFGLQANLINSVSINRKLDLIARPKDMSLSNDKLCQMLNCKISSISKQIQILKQQES